MKTGIIIIDPKEPSRETLRQLFLRFKFGPKAERLEVADFGEN